MKHLYMVLLLFGVSFYSVLTIEVTHNYTTVNYNKALQEKEASSIRS